MFSEKDIERHVRKLEPPEDWHPTVRLFIRFVVALIGFIVLLIGILMLIFPGPAFIVIPAGLAILASQFRWAKDLLYLVMSGFRWVGRKTSPVWQRLTRKFRKPPGWEKNYIVINRKK